MIIGVPREQKEEEYRVAILPQGVQKLTESGHKMLLEQGAGKGAGIEDDVYKNKGAEIVSEHGKVFEKAELILKVKEPKESEYNLLQEGQLMFSYFHFASSRSLTEAMLKRKIVAFAYETLEEDGRLPLLIPMSEIAGKLSVQEGIRFLGNQFGGKGILLGGATGVRPGKVLVLGGGTVGENAARVAAGLGAEVTILDINVKRLRFLKKVLPENVKLLYFNKDTLREELPTSDLVIGAVLIPGAKAPKLISREMLKIMQPKSVIVDVAIDQGGCIETSHPTTYKDPVYVVDGIIHYCVANLPGAVSRTATFALCNVTFPYVLLLAERGEKAIKENMALRSALNLYRGRITSKVLAETFGMEYHVAEKILY